MHILKTKSFHKWAQKAGLNNKSLKKAITEIETGLYDAKLGGYLLKKRVGLKDKGKRGGARTIIAFKKADKAIFVYGYTKNERANITEKEKKALSNLAQFCFTRNMQEIERLIETKALIEV